MLFHNFIDCQDILFGDPAIQVCDFFQASDLVALVLLHRIGRIHLALMGTSIQPGEALTQQLHI